MRLELAAPCCLVLGTIGCAAVAAAEGTAIDSGAISGLGARNIGAGAMSGRIAALAGFADRSGKLTLFVGAASGGVWKSTDGATTFKPVFDEQPVQSIGASAVDPTHHDNVWVGTGETWTRNSVSIGNGIYKSTDAGETWTFSGLPESERISRILVDPRASDTVYACVPGKLWSDSADRGLYRTADGGKTWQLVLKGGNLSTGCGDVSMQPGSADVLIASLWDFRRRGWTYRSGGESPKAPSGSGLYRSTDGGASWTELTTASGKGLPPKPYGRIAVRFAPSEPKTAYAFIESTDSGLLVSHDGGDSWERGDKSQWMVWRPFYFANLIVDPRDAKRVFKTDGNLILSEDGGKSFAVVGGFNGMHGDLHDLWIDPNNSQHVFAGDDGGLWISYDGGNRWWKSDNLPIAQFYHVSVDDRDPYRVYGGLQDNSSWVGDSAYPGGITSSRWENMFGGDGFWMFEDPSDSDYVYAEYQGGFIGRVNRHTHETRDIQPRLGAQELKRYKKLRFNWNTPIALSPHDPSTIYIGAQFLFRSHDHGQTWQRISPDLTTNDPQKQKQEESGGVTVDNSVAEMHTTIFSISESPLTAGLIWVGTDDGNLQLTRDGGGHWENVVGNVRGLPKNSWVNWVQAGQYAPGTAYAAFDRHTFGDMTPYVYVTKDYGRTWTALLDPKDGKGVRGYAHVIKEDPIDPQLLYLGTELGLSMSVDGAAHWAQYRGGHLPTVSVRDLAVHARDSDLVIATHSRGLNRVVWTMHRSPPHVPPAVQVAFAGTQGPRVPPGTYRIRMVRGDKTYDTQLTVGLDRRVKWTVAVRKAQYDAAMNVYTLFNDESALFARISGLRAQVAEAGKGRAEEDPLHKKLADFDGKLDELRRRIVATKEGGAITGEERLREHTDQLYGALLSWEGPPSAYQIDNIAAMRAELSDIDAGFAALTARELPALNSLLQKEGLKTLAVPTPGADEQPGAGAHGGGGDIAGGRSELQNLRLWN